MVNVDLMARHLPALKRVSFRAVLAATGMAVLTGIAGSPATAHPATATAPEAKAVAQAVAAPATEAAVVHAKAVAAAPAAKPATKTPAATKAQQTAKAPSRQQLMPAPVAQYQESFKPTAEQKRNAEVIIETGQKMGLPPRAWVIAVATAAQESTLRNLGHLGDHNDHDSLGLFQQRPSAGWGTPDEITDPVYSSKAFYTGLKNVEGYDRMALTDAAQTVQVSAFPDHYAKWEKLAADLVLAKYGQGPYAA
ncbi:hypothetical protein Cme02nite_53820 [Catellatospora methionotrophica]|uniref:Uncharacterized protein n=1 Tax=Catellatospora methionotrophica TaxID=121620 RepID=A0A8J3LM39_9ACTN|nr:hypothetical protein [Catellatospora methionotrophica]GIG17050.1 hypothetical protein Cme02nite_53820 [Catellatospora methionotrophica]